MGRGYTVYLVALALLVAGEVGCIALAIHFHSWFFAVMAVLMDGVTFLLNKAVVRHG